MKEEDLMTAEVGYSGARVTRAEFGVCSRVHPQGVFFLLRAITVPRTPQDPQQSGAQFGSLQLFYMIYMLLPWSGKTADFALAPGRAEPTFSYPLPCCH